MIGDQRALTVEVTGIEGTVDIGIHRTAEGEDEVAVATVETVAVVEAENLATFAEGLEPGFIISPSYDRAWVQENLLSE